MYAFSDYIRRGLTFVNNQAFPGKKKLSTFMIYATDLCDSACKHCLIWAKRPTKFLPFDKIVEVMQSKCITPHTSVGLEGGEFMLHPDAEKIMEWFYFNHKNFDLLSNCLKPDPLIAAVKKFPPRRLLISLDGPPDTYLHMRGKPGYDSVIRVIEALKDVVPMSVMFCLTPYNDFSDMRYVAELCKKYGVDLRIGIYNDISFFDTVDPAHATPAGSLRNDAPLTFQQVRTMRGGGSGVGQGTQILTEAKALNHEQFSIKSNDEFIKQIPEIVSEFQENYDFLVLYNQWRQNQVKLKCHSILDSLVLLPDGDVPLCQTLSLKLGNVYKNSLDEIFNGEPSQKTQKHYEHNCNLCWLNFHRKYDIVLYRTFEKYFGRGVTTKLFGYYQWNDSLQSYHEIMKDHGGAA